MQITVRLSSLQLAAETMESSLFLLSDVGLDNNRFIIFIINISIDNDTVLSVATRVGTMCMCMEHCGGTRF